jgi:hypothetical protein
VTDIGCGVIRYILILILSLSHTLYLSSLPLSLPVSLPLPLLSLPLFLVPQDIRVGRMGNPQLLMQIHDELIYEVALGPDCAGSESQIASRCE